MSEYAVTFPVAYIFVIADEAILGSVITAELSLFELLLQEITARAISKKDIFFMIYFFKLVFHFFIKLIK